jgi:hypothetical protein
LRFIVDTGNPLDLLGYASIAIRGDASEGQPPSEPERKRRQHLVSGLEKLRDDGSPLMHAHLPIDVLQMIFDRLLGDIAPRSNGFVAQPLQNQIDDLFFSIGQAIGFRALAEHIPQQVGRRERTGFHFSTAPVESAL